MICSTRLKHHAEGFKEEYESTEEAEASADGFDKDIKGQG